MMWKKTGDDGGDGRSEPAMTEVIGHDGEIPGQAGYDGYAGYDENRSSLPA